jgi:hypothetical protein
MPRMSSLASRDTLGDSGKVKFYSQFITRWQTSLES